MALSHTGLMGSFSGHYMTVHKTINLYLYKKKKKILCLKLII